MNSSLTRSPLSILAPFLVVLFLLDLLFGAGVVVYAAFVPAIVWLFVFVLGRRG